MSTLAIPYFFYRLYICITQDPIRIPHMAARCHQTVCQECEIFIGIYAAFFWRNFGECALFIPYVMQYFVCVSPKSRCEFSYRIILYQGRLDSDRADYNPEWNIGLSLVRATWGDGFIAYAVGYVDSTVDDDHIGTAVVGGFQWAF